MAKLIAAVDDSASIRQMVNFTLKGAGATGWIVKPFQPEKLLAVVKKLVG